MDFAELGLFFIGLGVFVLCVAIAVVCLTNEPKTKHEKIDITKKVIYEERN